MGVSVEVRELKSALKDFMNLAQDIRNQRERYTEMIEGLGAVGAPELSDIPKGPPNPGDKIGAILIRVEKLRDEIAAMERDYAEIEDKLESVLKHIKSPDEKNLIRLRYIDCKSWSEITIRVYKARDIKVGRDNKETLEHSIQSVHGKALVHMIEVCNENPLLKFWGTPSD